MKIYDIKSFYIITDLKEHLDNKMLLLSMINSTKSDVIKEGNDFVTKTDWNYQNEKREYFEKFIEIIKPYMAQMTNELSCSEWNINNLWYQLYHKKSKHEWHVHTNTNYTNIYYLHLPDEKLKTQLYDVREKKIIDNIEIKEGQMLTFPAHIIHRSPENNTEETKVIISFNSNFDKVKM
tara:strand:- start:988 stop:1524 length:537 start_codon:yes stop_codon:yes gene_type:complete